MHHSEVEKLRREFTDRVGRSDISAIAIWAVVHVPALLDAAAHSGAGDSPAGSRPPAQAASAAGGRLPERQSPAAIKGEPQ